VRNAGDAQQIEVGWWPGDPRYPRAAFFAYAYPAPEGFAAETPGRLRALLEIPAGQRVSEWERLRRAPVRTSGPSLGRALARAAEVISVGAGQADLTAGHVLLAASGQNLLAIGKPAASG
jgi:hypothetical protein